MYWMIVQRAENERSKWNTWTSTFLKQDCIPVECVSPARYRTGVSLPAGGGLPGRDPPPPQQRPHPPDRDHPLPVDRQTPVKT